MKISVQIAKVQAHLVVWEDDEDGDRTLVRLSSFIQRPHDELVSLPFGFSADVVEEDEDEDE